MLPDLRFVFGALITLALMGMVAVGLFVSARLSLQAKMGPLEASRSSVFTDSVEWNQFSDAGSVRRFVGLARRGEARETADAPPEHLIELLTGAPSVIAVAPADLPAPDRLAAPEAATASAIVDVTSPADGPTTIATPALPEPIRESPAPERAAVESTERAPDLKPGVDETIVAHTPAIPLPGAPSLAEDRPPTTIPVAEAQQDRAAAVALETENGWDQESWDTTSAMEAGPGTAGRATDGPVATLPPAPAPAPAAEIAVLPPVPLPKPLPPTAPPPPTAAPHPAASLAKAAAPPPAARRTTPVKRVKPIGESEPAHPRAVSTPRARALASRQRAAPQTFGSNASQPPPGQPVFGPYFPYATPQPGSVQFGQHFGPHFGPQPPDRRSRQPAPRARAAAVFHTTGVDPRQFAPQPRPPALPQPGYGPAYGSR